MAEGSKGGGSPYFRTIKVLTGVAVIFMCFQVWLNKPVDRARVACWPLYKTVRFFGVTVVSYAVPTEYSFILKMSGKANRFYLGCIDKAGYLPGFEHAPEAAQGESE